MMTQNRQSVALRDQDVRSIREMYATKDYTQVDLATKFGVSSQHISALVHGKRRVSASGPISLQEDHRMSHGGCARSLEERFWANVDKDDALGCWEWIGGKNDAGYGRISLNGRRWRAHRLSYLLFRGAIPKGALVCHSCDNPACIRPDHLFLGSHKLNSRDMVERGRVAMGKRNGSHTHPERRPTGEANGAHKLSVNQVREIRECYVKGRITQRALAAQYSVAQSTIGDVLRFVTWPSVR